ncbi:MAG TPA: hypothetical protein DDY53_05070 [Clostridiales bacterium]|nr:hypothetical protein [Clostridiales bacterium]
MLKYKIVVGILILVNIITGIYIMWFIKVPITYTLEEYKEQMGFYDSYKEIKMIYFENYNLLKEQYKGEIDTTYVITTYTNLIDKYFNKIYQNTKDLKEEEIEKYFKENLAEIQINMGLAEVEEFINLVNILKSYKISERAYTGGKLVENSIKDYDTYMSFLLEMYYGEVTITFDVYLSKKDNIEEPIIKFIPVKEEL